MSANSKPAIVQSDCTVLLEVRHPRFEEGRKMLAVFAELVKTPEHLHTYRMTPLTVWNAASVGLTAKDIVRDLEEIAKFGVSPKVRSSVEEWAMRFGLVRLEQEGSRLVLSCRQDGVLEKLIAASSIAPFVEESIDNGKAVIRAEGRGIVKQELIRLGYPVEDKAGYEHGQQLAFSMCEELPGGKMFRLRSYQTSAVEAFYRGGQAEGGSGVLVLPCGAGKTILGIAAMERFQCETLILTTNVTSVRQWRGEILEKTTLTEDEVGEYSGATKDVKPVTIATYQILTHRKSKQDPFIHMGLFNERNWGLIIYDEVHLLPAPVFRVTADIQAKRRLGLTATLVREDGCEEDVFSLVGPKRFDVPWKELEEEGWIAQARCVEIRVPMMPEWKTVYEAAEPKNKMRVAGENPYKMEAISRLLRRHAGLPTLIIGQYLDQLGHVSRRTGAPLITGDVPHEQREELFARFRKGELLLLIVSKVANFAVDLPDAAVAIQISGSFGSRQEEAQRLGRVLRPKTSGGPAFFYSLVTEGSKEMEFSLKRQLFLVEQGYRYEVQTVAITEQPELMQL